MPAQDPQVIEWLRNYSGTVPFLQDVRRYLIQHDRITPRQYTAVLRNYRADQEGRPVDERTPAMSTDLAHIRNGTYTVEDGSEHLTFQIYTATRGQLQGKRLVKRRLANGTYKAFGFLAMQSSEGGAATLRVWQRYVADEEEGHMYIKFAKALVYILDARQILVETGTISQAYHNGTNYAVHYSTTCRRCNRRLTTPTSVESGIGPECAQRDGGRTVAANPHGTDANPASSVPRTRSAAAPRAYRTVEDRQAAERTQPEPVQPILPISELGTGYVQ